MFCVHDSKRTICVLRILDEKCACRIPDNKWYFADVVPAWLDGFGQKTADNKSIVAIHHTDDNFCV